MVFNAVESAFRPVSGIKKLAAIRRDLGGEHRGAGTRLDGRARRGGKLTARRASEHDVSVGIDGQCGCVVGGRAAEQRTPNLVAGRVDFHHRRIGTWRRNEDATPAGYGTRAASGLGLRRTRRWLSKQVVSVSRSIKKRASAAGLRDRAYACRSRLCKCARCQHQNQGDESYRATAETFRPLRPRIVT